MFDFEDHGMSLTLPLSQVCIEFFAVDLTGVFEAAKITSSAMLVAHSFRYLIAVRFALKHPEDVSKLILIGPLPLPLAEADNLATYGRVETVRTRGISSIVHVVATLSTTEKTKTSNLLESAAIRTSLLGQNPTGYAKACAALAGAKGQDFAAIKAKTLIVTGSKDRVSPPQLCEKSLNELGDGTKLHVLENVGYWHVFEDLQDVASALENVF
jgi:pimeloyl-ACP methyl ester carboxylesterase